MISRGPSGSKITTLLGETECGQLTLCPIQLKYGVFTGKTRFISVASSYNQSVMSKPALLSQREKGAGGTQSLGGMSKNPLGAIPAHIQRPLPRLLLTAMQCQGPESCSWGAWGWRVG